MDTIFVGKKQLQLRKLKGRIQEDVAAYFNISKQAVSKWENGISMPDILILPEIAKYFEVDMSCFFDKKSAEKTVPPLNKGKIVISVRRKEFNGLKIIGASKGQILKMTLIETLIVLGTGMAIGLSIIISVAGKFSLDNLGVFDFIVDWKIFTGICLSSAILGLTAGMIPSFLTVHKLKRQFRNE
jgi:transcriptional regulator with XRE-family HTH domain